MIRDCVRVWRPIVDISVVCNPLLVVRGPVSPAGPGKRGPDAAANLLMSNVYDRLMPQVVGTRQAGV
jgi:hypothetical protein